MSLHLTSLQCAVAGLLLDGLQNKAIARAISPTMRERAVSSQIETLRRKTGTKNRVALALALQKMEFDKELESMK